MALSDALGVREPEVKARIHDQCTEEGKESAHKQQRLLEQGQAGKSVGDLQRHVVVWHHVLLFQYQHWAAMCVQVGVLLLHRLLHCKREVGL